MIYITEDDLTDDSYKIFIDTSTGDTTAGHNILDANEKKAIGIAKTYMDVRYDVDKIFDEAEPLRNDLLVDIICKITLYKVFRRNAARKVGATVKEDYDWAMKELGRINSGAVVLAGLPVPVDEDDQSTVPGITGNTSNEDYYI